MLLCLGGRDGLREMAKSIKANLKWHWEDLVAILVILVKELVVAVAIVTAAWILQRYSDLLFPQRGLTTELTKALADIFALLAFIALAVRDLQRYFRSR